MAYPPRWWKDPANSRRIVHTINHAVTYEQRTTYLAFTERNAGQLFQTNNYAARPPYWDTEVGEARMLTDHPSAALNDEQVLRAAHRVGVARRALTAWPNFEAAWYPHGQDRGTIFVKDNLAGVEWHDVLVSELQQAAWVIYVEIPWRCSTSRACGSPLTHGLAAGPARTMKRRSPRSRQATRLPGRCSG